MHLSLGGKTIRVRISNAYGTAPLHLTAVHLARPLPGMPGAIVPESDTALTFSGAPTSPCRRARIMSPIRPRFPWRPLSDVAITMHWDALAAQPTGHPGSRATSFVAHGDVAAAAQLSASFVAEHWYVIQNVEVDAPPIAGAAVAFGDSITDGRGATPDKNERWPDDLARRFQAAHIPLGVVNMGIGGNRVLLDSLGPNALARFDRDVLAQGGVRDLVLLEGINDLGVLTREAPATPQAHAALVADLIAAYRQIVTRAHSHGIRVMAGTLMPWAGFTYYHPDVQNEADRQAINAWIRAPGHFDAVVDFDARLRDPAEPGRLLPAFESGDHLHPSPAGYQAMADLIPLGFFGARSPK